ncbi:hypothetical protein [Paenibacillus endoradicis]|uniref:hypothetical protein n=1 Tax=Paenibacillus endoradicis TaxID=2972487 RepID=UPI0021598354|nr:hypothetical protein [Paenibacillus endoradicis]MCR8656957.1 hypothetical protein [Paenibacillus endoradicis]
MSDKLKGYIDDLTNKRKILTKGEFVELSPGATKEILEILVHHKEVLEQLEQAQQESQKLIEAIQGKIATLDKRIGNMSKHKVIHCDHSERISTLEGEAYMWEQALKLINEIRGESNE